MRAHERMIQSYRRYFSTPHFRTPEEPRYPIWGGGPAN